MCERERVCVCDGEKKRNRGVCECLRERESRKNAVWMGEKREETVTVTHTKR